MLRRTLMLGTSALALTACNGFSKTVVTISSDVALIANGLKGVLAQLSALGLPQLTASVMGAVGVAVAGLQQVAAAIAQTYSNTAAQPLVQQIEGYVNAIVGALAGLPLPPPISTALAAATILLPIIEAAIGMVTNLASRKMAMPAMTADQARLVLKAAAG